MWPQRNSHPCFSGWIVDHDLFDYFCLPVWYDNDRKSCRNGHFVGLTMRKPLAHPLRQCPVRLIMVGSGSKPPRFLWASPSNFQQIKGYGETAYACTNTPKRLLLHVENTRNPFFIFFFALRQSPSFEGYTIIYPSYPQALHSTFFYLRINNCHFAQFIFQLKIKKIGTNIRGKCLFQMEL